MSAKGFWWRDQWHGPGPAPRRMCGDCRVIRVVHGQTRCEQCLPAWKEKRSQQRGRALIALPELPEDLAEALLQRANDIGVPPHMLMTALLDRALDDAEAAAVAESDHKAKLLRSDVEFHSIGKLILVFVGGEFAGVSLQLRGAAVHDLCPWVNRALEQREASNP